MSVYVLGIKASETIYTSSLVARPTKSRRRTSACVLCLRFNKPLVYRHFPDGTTRTVRKRRGGGSRAAQVMRVMRAKLFVFGGDYSNM